MLFVVKEIDYLFLWRVFSPDLNGAFDQVDIFEDLKPKIVIEIRVVGEEFVDDIERLLRFLAADECTEPAVNEEDLAISFKVGQLGERTLEIGQT